MAQIPNMNWMGNQPTGSAYDVYQYYLGGGSPGGTSTPSTGGGISSLPWYQQTGGGGGGGTGGNAFGYGTTVNPVSRGAYGQPGYTGGLSGDVQQTGWGRQDEPGGGAYLRPRKEIPGLASMAMSFVPGGNLLRRKIEGAMNPEYDPNKNLSGYGVAGLSDSQKGLYDSLAGENMLFKGPGGLKTLTGKNFTGKGYLEGQLDLAKGFGFNDMTDEEIEAAISEQKLNKKGQFKWKQMKEANAIYQKERALEKKEKERKAKEAEATKQAARQTRYEASKAGGREGGGWYGGADYSGGKSGDVAQAGPGRDKDDIMAQGGMVGDLTGDPEYRGWKKMYEANPEIGSLHEKHPTFIKFYKKYERDRKKFGGLAGLLYG